MFIYAFIATIFRTLEYILSKNKIKKISPIILPFILSFLVILILLPFFLFKLFNQDIFILNNYVFFGIFLSSFFNVVAIIFLMKAFKIGDISISVPIRNLNPIFVFFIGIIVLGEKFSYNLLYATFFVVIGILLLHYDKLKGIYLLRKETLFASITAISYSFAMIADKWTLNYINFFEYTFFLYLMIFFLMFLINAYYKNFKKIFDLFLKNKLYLLILSVIKTLGSVFTFLAISLNSVTKVILFLRLEVLLTIIFGGYYFKEKNIFYKIFGGILMLLGIIIVSII